jgi:hypothetical protein
MADSVSQPGQPGRPRRVCPRCGGAVEPGCLLGPSFAALGNPLHPNEVGWYDGHAGHGLLWPKLPARGYSVTAVRCTACGLVELFAL